MPGTFQPSLHSFTLSIYTTLRISSFYCHEIENWTVKTYAMMTMVGNFSYFFRSHDKRVQIIVPWDYYSMVIWFLCLLAMLARWRRKSGAEWKVYVRDAIATKEREREGARGEGGRSRERAKNVKLYLNWIGVCAAKRFHHPPNQITIIHVVTSFLSSTQSWHYFSLFFHFRKIHYIYLAVVYVYMCVVYNW